MFIIIFESQISFVVINNIVYKLGEFKSAEIINSNVLPVAKNDSSGMKVNSENARKLSTSRSDLRNSTHSGLNIMH